MKRCYSKPLFFAETYFLNDSISKCAYEVNDNQPISINKGDNLCSNGSDGHCYGGQNGKKGEIINISGGATVTLFNDGANSSACQYDWSGNPNIVYGYKDGEYKDLGTFAMAFYGNDSNEDNHSPGYQGAAFFS